MFQTNQGEGKKGKCYHKRFLVKKSSIQFRRIVMTSLSEDQQNALSLFQEISQIDDIDLCQDILRENHWDVETAVESFVSGRRPNPSRMEGTPYQRNVSSSSNSETTTTPVSTSSSRGLQNNSSNSRSSNTARASAANDNNFFSLLFGPLRWLFQARPISLNPEGDTRKYIQDFDMKFGSNHPNFISTTYQQAVSQAYQASKFLMVYLHSPLHEDSHRFCQGTLCSDNFRRFADENVLVWSGQVWDAEAYGLSMQLKSKTFPFVALLLCQSERDVQIADKVQGFVDDRQLIERMQNAMPLIENIRRETNRRVEATRLREQQDREYREAEETDRRNRELREKAEAEERSRLEEERNAREMQEALELSERLENERRISSLKESLIEEPAAGPDVSALRFQLPKGIKISRRFRKTDTIQKLFDFLSIHFADNEIEIKNFAVGTNFPKKNFEDMDSTIELEGLHPRGMLFVIDLDA